MAKILGFVVLLSFLLAGNLNAQTDTLKVEQEQPLEAEKIEEEEIKTVWGLTTYLGKKLANEMGNRMNLDESEPQTKKRVRKVRINLGPIKIERTETI